MHLTVTLSHGTSGSLNIPITIPPLCIPIDHHSSGLVRCKQGWELAAVASK